MPAHSGNRTALCRCLKTLIEGDIRFASLAIAGNRVIVPAEVEVTRKLSRRQSMLDPRIAAVCRDGELAGRSLPSCGALGPALHGVGFASQAVFPVASAA
jgi:hypothetical protein